MALTAEGLPPGVGSALAPEQVAAPGTSEWTLEVDPAATAGSYLVELVGDDGSEQKSVPFALTLEAALAVGPSLNLPADGATDIVLNPLFSWEPLPGATLYRFQLATDAGFTDVLADETVAQTSLAPNPDLDLDTTYYWRVLGSNLCGDGQWSDVFSFTTRLEPQASLSSSALSFVVDTNTQAADELVIGNTGTGNLTFSIQSDQGADSRLQGGRDTHDPALDEVLDVPDFSVAGAAGGGPAVDFQIPAGLTSSGSVVGFSFEGTVTGVSSGSDWASDLRLVITSPDGASFDVGGYEPTVNSWDFQGQGSASNGTYSSTHGTAFGAEGTTDAGQWNLSFRHGWEDSGAGTMDWSDVTITLHKQPLPQCRDELSSVGWLSVDPASGSVPAAGSLAVSVMVDSAGLIPDAYVGYLCIDTNDPQARPAVVEVELLVEGDPISIAEVTPNSLAPEVVENQSTSVNLDIGNRGNAELTWSITTALPQAPSAEADANEAGSAGCAAPVTVDWLEVTPPSGSVAASDDAPAASVSVAIDGSGLQPGIRQALLCVQTNDPAKPLIEVPVNLTVLGDPLFEDRFEIDQER